MLYISNAVHALSFSALTVFAWVGNTNLLWVPQQDLVFVRSNDVIYGLRFPYYLCAHLTFGDQLREWKVLHSRPLYWGWNVEPRWRRALASLLAAFVEVWCILTFCSGGLVRNSNPQLFTTFIVQGASITFHGRVWSYISVANWYILHKFTGVL